MYIDHNNYDEELQITTVPVDNNQLNDEQKIMSLLKENYCSENDDDKPQTLSIPTNLENPIVELDINGYFSMCFLSNSAEFVESSLQQVDLDEYVKHLL